MRRKRARANSAGLMVDATRDSGRTANRMERESIVTKKELRGLVSGPMAERLDGFSD
jgi:hypothetical protein